MRKVELYNIFKKNILNEEKMLDEFSYFKLKLGIRSERLLYILSLGLEGVF